MIVVTSNATKLKSDEFDHKTNKRSKPLKSNSPSRTITFRIDGDIFNKLEKEAERREISLNTLSNQVFRSFLEWDRLQPEAGMIPIAKPVIAELFGEMSKEQIEKLAKRVGKNTMHDMVLFMKKNMDIHSFLSWLEMWAKKNSSAGFSCTTAENGFQTCIMKHDLGENYSLYHKIVLETLFNEILRKPIHITMNTDTIVFKIKKD